MKKALAARGENRGPTDLSMARICILWSRHWLGYGGNAAAYEHTSLFRFQRTPNFLVANAVSFPRLAGVGSDEHYAGRGVDPNLWYMIGDATAGGAEIKLAPLERPVLYRRGTPRGEPEVGQE
jgi:hypothetical protein